MEKGFPPLQIGSLKELNENGFDDVAIMLMILLCKHV